MAASGLSQEAQAQAECGVATGDRVICQPAGNPYPNGVNYLDSDDLTVVVPAATVVTGGVLVVTGTNGTVEQAGNVSSSATGRAGARLTSGQAASYRGTGPVATTGDFAPGLSVTGAGPASVTARDVSTIGNGSAGILATGSNVTIDLSGRVSTIGTGATVGAGGIGGGFPTAGQGGASNPGLDPADLTGPSAITFFDYFIFDNAGIPADAFNTFLQWNVTGGTVDLVGGVGPGVLGAPPNQPNGRYVDLGGSTGNPGLFETRMALPVMPGTFNLSFDYRSTGGDLNSATASVNGQLAPLASYTVSSDQMTFRRFSGNFAVDAIDLVRIAFQGAESDTDNSGIGIDGVLFGPVLPVGPGGGTGTATPPGSALGFVPAGMMLGADAVVATATSGTATVTNTGIVSATGMGSRGIVATGTNGVTIAGTGRVTTAGDLATGIEALSPGAVSVTQGSVATTGMMAPAIRATSTGAGAVSVDVGNISTAGFASRGIDAFATNGSVSVRAGGASTNGSNADAIVAMNNAGGPVSVIATGPVTTTGTSSAGIRAMAAASTASVTAANVSTTAGNATAITAAGATGVSVTASGLVSSAGANTPVIIATTVSGPANVTATGPVSKSGAGGNALIAQSTNGSATVAVRGLTSAGGGVVANAGTFATVTVTGLVATADTAVVANGANAIVSIAAGGAIASASDAVALQGRTGSTLDNAGTITAAGSAIFALNGPVTVTNSGTIAGRVRFGAGADRFGNTGLFSSALNSDFGEGIDTFDNAGVVRALSASRSVTFAGLEAFNNGGLVDLRNGSAGDSFVLPGTYTGSGAGTLALDATLGGAPSADRLSVGNAAGSTAVVLANTGGVTLTPRTVIVQAAGASSANAFTLAAGSTGTALVGLAIVYDPANFSYAVVGTPQAGVFRTLSAAEGVRNLWHNSADAWSGHVRALRDGQVAEGSAIWGQFYGATNSRDNDRSFTTFGQVSTPATGYRQDAFGAQGGVDLGRMDANGGFVFGVTGGYLDSTLNFRGAADRTTFSVINAGAYASFRGGPFFVNALGKYDWIDMKLRAPTLGFVAEPDARAWGGQLEAGLRFGGDFFFAEPILGLAYVNSRIDDLATIDNLGSRIGIDSQDGIRGKAGLRIGATHKGSTGGVLAFYASGEAVKQFRGRDRIAFTSGTTTLSFDGGRIGTYGRATLGLNVAMPGGVTGFVEAHGEYGEDWKGGGGRGGLRVTF